MDLNMEIAWNTINLISIEYNYMWDKIDKLELLLYQQQNVIAQLLSAVIESECQYQDLKQNDNANDDDDREEFEEDFETKEKESEEEINKEGIKNEGEKKELHFIDQNIKFNNEDLKNNKNDNEINLIEENQIFTSNDYVQFRDHSMPIISENDFENLNQIDLIDLKCKLILSNEVLSSDKGDSINTLSKSNLITVLPEINGNISQLNSDLIKSFEKEFHDNSAELNVKKFKNDQFYITDNFRRPALTKEATIYVDSFDHNYQTINNLENKEIVLKEKSSDNEVSKDSSNNQYFEEIETDKKNDANNQMTTHNPNEITAKEFLEIEKINKELATKQNLVENDNKLLNKQNSKPEESSIFSSITNSMFQSYQNVMNRSIFKKEPQSTSQIQSQIDNKSPIRNIFGGFKSLHESIIKKDKFPISGGGPQLSLPDMVEFTNSDTIQVEKKTLIRNTNEAQINETINTNKVESKKNEKLSHRTQSMLEANTMLDELKMQNDSNDHLKIILEKSFSTESAIFTISADNDFKSNATLPELKENDELNLNSPFNVNDNENFEMPIAENETPIEVCLENGQKQKEEEKEEQDNEFKEKNENRQVILDKQHIIDSINETKPMINKIKTIDDDISLSQIDDQLPKPRKKTKWIAAVVNLFKIFV